MDFYCKMWNAKIAKASIRIIFLLLISLNLQKITKRNLIFGENRIIIFLRKFEFIFSIMNQVQFSTFHVPILCILINAQAKDNLLAVLSRELLFCLYLICMILKGQCPIYFVFLLFLQWNRLNGRKQSLFSITHSVPFLWRNIFLGSTLNDWFDGENRKARANEREREKKRTRPTADYKLHDKMFDVSVT